MGRRIVYLMGLTLAVGFFAPPALAQQEAAPGAPANPEKPLALPPLSEEPDELSPIPPEVELPLDPPKPASGKPKVGDKKTSIQAEVDPAAKPAPVPLRPVEAPAALRTLPDRRKSGELDSEFQRAGVAPGSPADSETDPLPGAKEPAGKPAAGKPGADPPPVREHFVIQPERVPLGKQTINLTVDVQSPQFLNLKQEASLKIIVRNSGKTDAMNVTVRDELPPGLDYLNSQPVAQNAPGDPLLVWKLATVPAESDRVIIVRVKPTKIGPFDHAATVSMEAGSKARTIVREPRLKVEQTVNSAKVLKGQQVEFKIVVQNTGDGPARNVIVQAKLSAGLRHESGEPNDQNLFERQLEQPLMPGERVALEPLLTDTIQGGEQTCTILVKSPDVIAGADEARCSQLVSVVEPKLKMTLAGPDKRFTDTDAKYEIHVENPGTAVARKVRILATLPVGGRLKALPAGARYEANSRRLEWTMPQLDPKEAAKLAFTVRMGGVGLYQVAAETKAEGGLYDKGVVPTNVIGIAFLDCAVSERRRVVDEGESTVFQVKITNTGTKEATNLLVTAEFSENVRPVSTDVEGNQDARFDPKRRLLVFPKIDRLVQGKEMIIGIKVEALKAGKATCRVNLVHDEDPDTDKFAAMATFRVTPSLRQ